MSQLSLNNLDKSNWQKLPFGEIAQSIGERVDPTKTDLETYVGLEHIDPDSIHIKRFGKREDVSGTKLRCYPGDVIFGRRRAYQRKAAICEFDGFCSAHSLVLRAIPEVIDPKLFPFFLHSDQFMHRAVDISVGGLSPTINWTKLKKEEFLLPPKDQQSKLADLLWAADALIDSQKMADQSLELLKSARIKELLWDEYDPVAKTYTESRASWKLAKLSEKCDLITKGTTPTTAGYSFTSSGIKFFKIESFDKDGNLVPDGTKYISEAAHEALARSQLKVGDILFSIAGALGRAALVNSAMVPGNTNQALCVIRPNNDHLLSEFLIQILRSDYIQNLIARINVKAAQANISLTNVRDFVIPIPPLDDQRKVFSQISIIEGSVKEAALNHGHSKNLLKSLINQIF